MVSDGTEVTENQFGKYLERRMIFRDENCLAKGYKPDIKNILHRENEIDVLMRDLSKALINVTPRNMLVYGKTGTGKTMLLRVLTEQLEKEAPGHHVKIKTVYIKCDKVSTKVGVVKALITDLAMISNRDIKAFNSFDAYFNKFCALANEFNGQLIIILDEIDRLQDLDIINLFARVKESEDLEKNITVIGITNNVRFDEELDARTKSVLGQRDILFPPYDANQLGDILNKRAEIAFLPGVLDETVIPLCAAYAAQEHGDARKAIELLMYSGNIAEEQHVDKVTEKHVCLAKERKESNKTTEFIRTLPTQSKLVFAACISNVSRNPQTYTYTGEVYSSYKQMAQEIGIEILTQRRVTDLLNELSMASLLSVVDRSKGRFGRTKEVMVAVLINKAWNTLMEDDRLKNIKSDHAPPKGLEIQGASQAFLKQF